MADKGNVYLARLFNEHENFYKIGSTVHRYNRFYQLMKNGYRVEIVCMVMGIEYLRALELEGLLHGKFCKNRYLPKKKFGGYRECFSDVNKNEFMELLINETYKEVVENLEITWR